MKRKSILLMMPTLTQGGFERICILTARMLQEHYDVSILVFTRKGQFYDVSDLSVMDIDIPAKPGKMRKLFNVLKRVKVLKKIRKQNKYDYVYSFGTSANLVNVLSRKYGKTIIGVRGYEAIDNKIEMWINTKLADKVVCCSKVIEEGIRNNYSTKELVTLYNPCDVERICKLKDEINELKYEELFDGSKKIIMSMGREDDEKGFWHLLKAFSLVSQKVEDARLLIMGAGDFNEYVELAKKLKIHNKTFFLEAQENPFQYLKRATLYLLTSRSEGFPNALIEAMAVGVPVMSVNCKSGPAEILSDNYLEVLDDTKTYYSQYGIILPMVEMERNMDADVIDKEEIVIAEEMIKMLCDDAKLIGYGKKSSERARDFSNDRYIQGFIDML